MEVLVRPVPSNRATISLENSYRESRTKFKTDQVRIRLDMTIRRFPGSLSLDGKQLLVNDFKNSKLVLIDVDSLKQETVSSDPRIYTAWFDSQIDAIFVLKLREDVKIGERRQIVYPNSKDYEELTGLGLVDLYRFVSIAKIHDDKPSWMRSFQKKDLNL